MVGSLCNTTKSILKKEGTKIGRVVEESSTISCYNDYNRLITFWDGEQDFVDYMVNTKDQLNELKDELSRLLEIAKSFPSSFTASIIIPAFSGLPGPGEMMILSGERAFISSMESSSFLITFISGLMLPIS